MIDKPHCLECRKDRCQSCPGCYAVMLFDPEGYVLSDAPVSRSVIGALSVAMRDGWSAWKLPIGKSVAVEKHEIDEHLFGLRFITPFGFTRYLEWAKTAHDMAPFVDYGD